MKLISIPRRVRPKPSGGDSGNTSTEQHSSLIVEQHSSLIVDNVDMIMQILVRLPVKYLLRSKSVSKTWFFIITDPSFVRNYSVRNRHSVSGLLLDQYSDEFAGKYEFIPLDKQPVTKRIKKRKGTKRIRINKNVIRDIPFKTLNFLNDRDGCFKIEQSCSGLLCCRYSVLNSRHKPELTAYYIYNPSTKSYKILPASPFRQDGYRSVGSVSLAFDPLKSPYYEVVCISSSNNKKKAQIEIYCSKSSSWRLCKAPFEYVALDADMYKSGVFWNGSLHWVSERISVYFDVDQELLKEMPMLPTTEYNSDDVEDDSEDDTDDDEDDSDYDDDDSYSGDSDDNDDIEDNMIIEYFGDCGGHLYLVQIIEPHFRFKVLEMKTDYTGWNVKYRGNLKKMTRRYPKLMLDQYMVKHNFGLDFSILHVEEKEEEEPTKMVIRVINKVISYDLKKKCFKFIHKLPDVLGPELNSPAWFEAYQFLESLASV